MTVKNHLHFHYRRQGMGSVLWLLLLPSRPPLLWFSLFSPIHEDGKEFQYIFRLRFDHFNEPTYVRLFEFGPYRKNKNSRIHSSLYPYMRNMNHVHFETSAHSTKGHFLLRCRNALESTTDLFLKSSRADQNIEFDLFPVPIMDSIPTLRDGESEVITFVYFNIDINLPNRLSSHVHVHRHTLSLSLSFIALIFSSLLCCFFFILFYIYFFYSVFNT